MKLSLNQQEVVEYFCLFLLGLVGQLFVQSAVDYIIGDDIQKQLIAWSTLFGIALILTVASRMFLLETSEHRHLAQVAESYRKLEADGFFSGNAGSKHVLQQQQLRWGSAAASRR